MFLNPFFSSFLFALFLSASTNGTPDGLGRLNRCCCSKSSYKSFAAGSSALGAGEKKSGASNTIGFLFLGIE